MSFKLFIYYCALCGGWAAFLAWGVALGTGIRDIQSVYTRAALVAAVLGLTVAGAIGMVDAVLNAVGFQRLVRVAVCLGIGLMGGMIGGFIGQVLNSKVGVPVFIGWILTGVGVGASIGVYDLLRAATQGGDMRVPIKKTLNGVYGGFLGGFLGGVPFGIILSTQMIHDKIPNSDLAIGLVILGLCIGLLVGLAQVVLKEAWVKVAKGFRAGRELMLSKDETTIGRAEGCDLGLFGDSAVEKLHARIVLKNSRYLLADVDTPGGTYLNDQKIDRPTPLKSGDLIRVGNCVIEFGERQKRK
jgi:hypothetical protein